MSTVRASDLFGRPFRRHPRANTIRSGKYGADEVRRLGPDAVNPHRVTYKKLTR